MVELMHGSRVWEWKRGANRQPRQPKGTNCLPLGTFYHAPDTSGNWYWRSPNVLGDPMSSPSSAQVLNGPPPTSRFVTDRKWKEREKSNFLGNIFTNKNLISELASSIWVSHESGDRQRHIFLPMPSGTCLCYMNANHG